MVRAPTAILLATSTIRIDQTIACAISLGARQLKTLKTVYGMTLCFLGQIQKGELSQFLRKYFNFASNRNGLLRLMPSQTALD